MQRRKIIIHLFLVQGDLIQFMISAGPLITYASLVETFDKIQETTKR